MGQQSGTANFQGTARNARIQEGTTVMLAVSHGRLVVAPVEARAYELETLLAGVTRKNVHTAVDTGDPVGRERW
jgi:antitoxin component of MazEF toxin-antitoxin module